MGMIKNVIVVEDITGKPVAISIGAISAAIMGSDDPGVLLFGMGMKEILALREQYMLRRGPLEMTVESIKKTFGSDYVVTK